MICSSRLREELGVGTRQPPSVNVSKSISVDTQRARVSNLTCFAFFINQTEADLTSRSTEEFLYLLGSQYVQ